MADDERAADVADELDDLDDEKEKAKTELAIKLTKTMGEIVPLIIHGTNVVSAPVPPKLTPDEQSAVVSRMAAPTDEQRLAQLQAVDRPGTRTLRFQSSFPSTDVNAEIIQQSQMARQRFDAMRRYQTLTEGGMEHAQALSRSGMELFTPQPKPMTEYEKGRLALESQRLTRGQTMSPYQQAMVNIAQQRVNKPTSAEVKQSEAAAQAERDRLITGTANVGSEFNLWSPSTYKNLVPDFIKPPRTATTVPSPTTPPAVTPPVTVPAIRATAPPAVAPPVTPRRYPPAPDKPASRVRGQVYSTAKGNFRWTGTGWVKVD